jgi:hypothetical protein
MEGPPSFGLSHICYGLLDVNKNGQYSNRDNPVLQVIKFVPVGNINNLDPNLLQNDSQVKILADLSLPVVITGALEA